MFKFYDWLILGGIFYSFLTSILLFFKSKRNRHANRFLGMMIFALAWYATLYQLAITGAIVTVPHLWRVGSPLYYLICPCFYLYVRAVLYHETRFKKYDWLHALPAILNFLELIPFFLTSTAEKQRIVNQAMFDLSKGAKLGSGLIPAVWHYAARPFIGLIYVCFIVPMLWRAFKDRKQGRPAQSGSVITVLAIFTLLVTLICSMMLYLYIFYRNSGAKNMEVAKLPAYVLGFAFFGLSLMLFFKPEILYDAPHENPPTDKLPELIQKTVKGDSQPPVTEEVLLEYADKLRKLITEKEAFRRKNLTITDLAVELKIPQHQLSYLLNHHFEQRFSDFINTYRVNYVKERLQNGDAEKLSIEGLGGDAGFSSRSSFFTVFKKVTGFTPSEFLQQQS